MSVSANGSLSETGARKVHGRCPERSSDSWMTTTRPFRITPQSISEPGPPFARNHALRRWMRQKTSGQSGSRYQGRPGMGVRRLKAGIERNICPSRWGVNKADAGLKVSAY